MSSRYTGAADAAPIKRRTQTWTCVGCEKPFEADRKRKYCTPACRKPFDRVRGKGPWNLQCPQCGSRFTADRRRKYCTPKCRSVANRTERKVGFAIDPVASGSCDAGDCANVVPTWATVETTVPGLWCSERCANRVAQRIIVNRSPGERPCVDCGDQVPVDANSTVRRCPPCQELTVKQNQAQNRQRRHEETRLFEVQSSGSFTCANCGEESPVSLAHPFRIVCRPCRSKKQRRAAKQVWKRRRAARERVRSEPFTVEDIIQRDGWDCHICGRPCIPVTFPYKYHPDHASIDHLIPISRGGDDVLANTRLAHTRCNSRRGNRFKVEQPSLFDI